MDSGKSLLFLLLSCSYNSIDLFSVNPSLPRVIHCAVPMSAGTLPEKRGITPTRGTTHAIASDLCIHTYLKISTLQCGQ